MSKVIWYIIVAATTLVVLILLWQFRIAIVLFFLSLAVAAALRPLINNITKYNLSRQFALAIVYLMVVGSIVGLFLLISPPLGRDLQSLIENFVTGYEYMKTNWPLTGTLFQKALAEQLPPSKDLYEALMGDVGAAALKGIFGVAQNFFTILGNIAIIVILSLYWSADQLRFERLSISLLRAEHHPKALLVWRSIEVGVGGYLRSQFIQSLFAGLILGLGYWGLGIRYPVLLALWAALARPIPWLGALIAVIFPLIVGMSISPALGLAAAMYTIGVLLLLRLVFEPRFFRGQRYSPLLIILFVIALAQLLGIIGVVLAPPLAVTVQILFQQLYPLPPRSFSQEMLEKAMNLKNRLKEVREHIQNAPREITILTDRMNRLIDRTIDYIQED